MTRASTLAPYFDALRERLFTLPIPTPSRAEAVQSGALVVALMSRVGGEGVTTVAVGLAQAMARVATLPTLLIDHGSGSEAAAARLGVAPRPFAGWPSDGDDRGLLDAVVAVEPARLGLLSLGTYGPSGLATDASWATAIAALRQSHALVLVDAGSTRQPLAQRWARFVDLRLLVVDTECTTSEELERLKVDWQASGQGFDAVVLNKREYPVPGFLYRHVR